MLRTLLESQAHSPRRAGGTLFSVGVHTTLIGLAVAATARATTRPAADPPEAHDVLYTVPAPTPLPNAPHPSMDKWHIALPANAPFVPPVTFPTTLPAIRVNQSTDSGHEFDGAHLASADPFVGRGEGAATGSSEVYTALAVEKAAVPRADNPAPAYPASLRSASLEGTVVARFVVDTTGRAEPASIVFIAATHPLFADAVKQALLRSRYLPATIGDRPVRQLVEQRFAFTLTR